jgi:hypothetical protein
MIAFDVNTKQIYLLNCPGLLGRNLFTSFTIPYQEA